MAFNQRRIDLAYDISKRDLLLKQMQDILEARGSVDRFVAAFQEVVDDMDGQYLRIRAARHALFGDGDPRCDMEIQFPCNELVDWKVNEPSLEPAAGKPPYMSTTDSSVMASENDNILDDYAAMLGISYLSHRVAPAPAPTSTSGSRGRRIRIAPPTITGAEDEGTTSSSAAARSVPNNHRNDPTHIRSRRHRMPVDGGLDAGRSGFSASCPQPRIGTPESMGGCPLPAYHRQPRRRRRLMPDRPALLMQLELGHQLLPLLAWLNSR